jgi:hypothetical protein
MGFKNAEFDADFKTLMPALTSPKKVLSKKP